MSVQSSLRQLASRISESIRKDRFRPVYGRPSWLREFLRTTVGAELRAADLTRYRNSAESGSLVGLARHFATRDHPKFLFDTTSLRNALHASRGNFQRWVSLACSEAAEMTDSGLPIYDAVAPPLRPGFAWDGRWEGGSEDVLYQARPHRFAFAPRLALAIVGGGYSSTEFAALLRDWMNFARRNPDLPFVSTFVVLQRLLASTCAFHLLPGTDSDAGADALRTELLKIIHQDVRFLIPRIGHSYPNAHLLTDRFAGWFIATIYPEFCDGRPKPEEAERLWVAELDRQTYDDGGSFEHSTYYHGLATEMAAAYWLLKRRNGGTLEPGCERRICELLRFEADLAGPDGNAPALGDAAEDPMFPLGAGIGTTPAMLREIYRRLAGAAISPLVPEHPAHERAFWLLGGEAPVEPQASLTRGLSSNPVTGVFAFFEHGEATRLVFRSGPAPDAATMSGHMHADLMSICLIYRREPLLVDPGTYSYRFEPSQLPSGSAATNWREYLTGPRAHNGIVIDDHDPLGTVTGDFRSGESQARARNNCVIDGDALAWVEAESLAPARYEQFVRGVIHVKGEYFLVYNVLAAETSEADVIFPLQLDHRVRIEREEDKIIAVGVTGEATATLVYSDELVVAGRSAGREDPPSGWVSPTYGVLRPATQLLFRPAGRSRASAFAFCLNENAALKRIASKFAGGSLVPLVFELAGSHFRDWVFLNPTAPERAISHAGVEFKGRLLWLRVSESGAGEMRALECAACSAPSLGLEFRSDAIQENVFRRWRLH